jgi:hypothetical protein
VIVVSSHIFCGVGDLANLQYYILDDDLVEVAKEDGRCIGQHVSIVLIGDFKKSAAVHIN